MLLQREVFFTIVLIFVVCVNAIQRDTLVQSPLVVTLSVTLTILGQGVDRLADAKKVFLHFMCHLGRLAHEALSAIGPTTTFSSVMVHCPLTSPVFVATLLAKIMKSSRACMLP